jgi:biopolymer transport protein ExbB/TolQ
MLFTIFVTLCVLLGVGWLWMRAEFARRQLVADSTQLVRQLVGGRSGKVDRNGVTELVRDVHETLKRRGLDALETLDRRLAIGLLRAQADAQRARVTASIELMPQLGLLGTVIGLMYSMLVMGDTSVGGIGTALLTTFVGLLGLLAARLHIEPSADEEHGRIVHLLGDLAGADSAEVPGQR